MPDMKHPLVQLTLARIREFYREPAAVFWVYCFPILIAIALGIAVINIHVPGALFGLFVAYGVSGYGMYVWKKMKGKPVSVIATSTDEPDEQGGEPIPKSIRYRWPDSTRDEVLARLLKLNAERASHEPAAQTKADASQTCRHGTVSKKNNANKAGRAEPAQGELIAP